MRRDFDEESRNAILAAVSRALAAHVPARAPLAVAFSGGRDSVALLDALLATTNAHEHPLSAIHVHHGLSSNADAWASFCAQWCAARGVALTVRHADVSRAPQSSLEAEARRVRYAALAAAAADTGVSVVALAQHRDDQVETLLLQLLRGAGPHGLAAMPAVRTSAQGPAWLRPLLTVSRAAIDAYVRAAGLRWVDDDSNASPAHLRNALRQSVIPALVRIAPSASTTLARAAAHQADAAQLADDLAALDARGASDGVTLDRAALTALSEHRARNLLRWFLRQCGLPAPSTARLAAMLVQLRYARTDASVRLPHAGAEVGIHRGRVMLHAPAAPAFDVPWLGERELALPHGLLVFERTIGAGLDAERLARAPVRVRGRAGGERFQMAPDRPRRPLKAVLRDAGVPEWGRNVPLVFCGSTLAAVAGVGIDVSFRAAPGGPGVTVAWHPRSP